MSNEDNDDDNDGQPEYSTARTQHSITTASQYKTLAMRRGAITYVGIPTYFHIREP